MIEFINIGLDDAISFRVGGEIQASFVETFFDGLREKTKTFNEVNVYVELTDFKNISFAVILERLRMLFSLFTAYHEKLAKIALISDTNYLNIAAEISDILHYVVTDHFYFEEKEQAINWLAENHQVIKAA